MWCFIIPLWIEVYAQCPHLNFLSLPFQVETWSFGSFSLELTSLWPLTLSFCAGPASLISPLEWIFFKWISKLPYGIKQLLSSTTCYIILPKHWIYNFSCVTISGLLHMFTWQGKQGLQWLRSRPAYQFRQWGGYTTVVGSADCKEAAASTSVWEKGYYFWHYSWSTFCIRNLQNSKSRVPVDQKYWKFLHMLRGNPLTCPERFSLIAEAEVPQLRFNNFEAMMACGKKILRHFLDLKLFWQVWTVGPPSLTLKIPLAFEPRHIRLLW